jgi:hypothetical protein
MTSDKVYEGGVETNGRYPANNEDAARQSKEKRRANEHLFPCACDGVSWWIRQTVMKSASTLICKLT